MKRLGTLLALILVAMASPDAMAVGTSPGQLYAFGSNQFGELGSSTGLGSSSAVPAPVSLPGATGPVTLVASGEFYSLAVTSTGQLFSFGLNNEGQLGVSTNSGTTNPNPTPMRVSLPGASGPILRVAAGLNYSLVLTTTGQLYSFGDNDFGENGFAADANPHPTPTLVTLPGANGAIVQVAAGSNSSLGLTATGQVFGWGDNNFGALGNSTNDTTDTANTPMQIVFPGQSGSVTQIAEGYNFGLAITSGGQLYTWGANSQGQLGFTPNNTPNPTPTLISLPGATGAPIHVYAGDSYSAVVTATGQLYAFGDNDFGELGNAVNNGTSNPNPTPTPVSLPGAVGGVVSGAAGTNRTLAVTQSGQLFAFGFNGFGELGFAPDVNPHPTPTLVSLPAGATVDAVNTGPWAFHTLVVIADLAITTSSLPAGQVEVPYNAAVSVAGGIPPYNWVATGLPPGLSINGANGMISGTTLHSGIFNPVFTVTDADGITTTRSLTISVAPSDLVVATSSLPAGRVGSPYSATVSATGGIPAYSWAAAGLPPGLSLNTTTGAISGTPSTAGSYTPVFTVTDADRVIRDGSLAISVAPPNPPVAQLSGKSVLGPTDVFKIACSGLPGQVCGGGVVATSSVREAGNRPVGVSARKPGHGKRPKPRPVTVAQVSYSVRAGSTGTVALKLNDFGERLLATFLRVPAHVSFTGSLSKILTVTYGYPRVNSPISNFWTWSCSSNGSCHTTVGLTSVAARKWLTIDHLPPHPKVILLCHGGGCPFGRRVFNPRGGGSLQLAPNFAGAQLRPGAIVELEILARNRVGKVEIFTVQTRSVPMEATRCFEPGARAPQRCT
jgi:alpha-tubulin suppressor-like RCC1 family protein